MMTAHAETLITPEEAQDVVTGREAISGRLRLPLMVVLGAIVVAIATMLILVVVSASNSRTGLDTLLPFLDHQPVRQLQL